jgi:hypothetical protein
MARDGYEADKNDVKIMDWKSGRQQILQQVGMTAFQEMFFGEQIQKRSIYSSLQRNKTTFLFRFKISKSTADHQRRF